MTDKSRLPTPILPGGTVTFLFTDIEGSTKLLDQLRDQYAVLLTAHHQIIREALERWHGREVGTEGDAFFVAFPKATEAVAAVAQIQRELAEHSWPSDVQVQVRMGLHTGEPWLVEQDYVGMDVHRAARIAHVGHGGQVLLSETTTALVQDELPEGVTLLDLGRHRLKDMRRPEPIQQLVIDGLPSEFPLLSSLEMVAEPGITAGDPEVRQPREVGPSPYRGLAAFRESDAPYFFGREDFTDELYDTVTRKPMTAVIVGSSGAGKSSAVAAGLLPRLRSEGDWLIPRFRPGSQPFHALATVLLPLLEPDLDETERLISITRLADALLAREISLIHIVDRLLEKSDQGARVLLIADQFEELYTLCPDIEVRQGFLDELLDAVHSAAGQPPARLVLLLTLRADFMGQALTHRPFADELKEGALLLGPMNREELQAAIEKPAEKQGAAFEAGLVPRILDDVGAEPGNLPLLEFALTLLWDQMDQGWMTHAAYDEIGRVDGALSRHADEVYLRLQEEEQEQARRVIVQLVQPGEGTEDTRRIAKRADLVGVAWTLVQRLADERLVVTGLDESGSETVEVVHEALIRSWGQLQEWMDADREFRRWQEGLRAARRAWEESGRDDGALLRGAPLVNAEEWRESRADELSQAEIEYIEICQLNRTETLARRERRRRLIVGGLAVGLVVALLLTIFAFGQQGEAQDNLAIADANAATADAERIRAEQEADGRATQQAVAEGEQARAETERERAETEQARAEAEKERAEQEADARATAQAEAVHEREVAEQQTRLTTSRELALAATNNLEIDPELSILLALEALSVAHTQEAEEALHWSIPAARTKLVLGPHEEVIIGIAITPDGQRVVTSSFDGTAKVWDVVTGEELLTFEGHTDAIYDVAVSPDGNLVATASHEDNTVRVWDINTGEERLQVSGHDGSIWGVWAVAFSPDGSLIASAGEDGLVKLWDLESGEEVLSIAAHSDRIYDIQFSPDGSRLISGGDDESAKIWDTVTGQELIALTGHDYVIETTAFSPDGSLAATASWDGTARVWDAESGEELLILPGHTSEVWGVAFSPDGEFIATASADGTAKLWSLQYGDEVFSLNGHDDRVKRVVFSPDGTRLVTSSLDNTARIWDITPGRELLSINHDGALRVKYSPDGTRIAGSSYFGPSWIWDAESGELLHTLEGHTAWVGGLEFSPDGDLIATGSDDTTAKIWDVETGQELMTLSGHEDWVNEVAFSPDGNYLATAGNQSIVNIWDLSSGLPVTTIDVQGERDEIVPGTGGVVWAVDFSPDGDRLAIGVDDTVEIWEAEGGQRLSIIEKPGSDQVRTVIFSPDGTQLAASYWNGTVKIWDLENNAELLHINASNSLISGMAFSSDWRNLATTTSDATVKYWDASTGERLLTLKGHTEAIHGLAISPDGNRLVSTSEDFTMRVWTLPLDELIAIGEARVTRALTTEECRQYLHMDACPVE